MRHVAEGIHHRTSRGLHRMDEQPADGVVSLEVFDDFRHESRLYERNGRPAKRARILGSGSACEAITTSAVETSAGSTAARAGMHKRAGARSWLPLRTKGNSACVGGDEMTATPGQATARSSRSRRPSVRSMPMQDVIVLAGNRPPSKLGALSQSRISRRARSGRATTGSVLAAAPASLCLCHVCDRADGATAAISLTLGPARGVPSRCQRK